MQQRARPLQRSGRFAGKPYRKSQKAYAIDYQVSLPTVKRWWAKGLPCDDADAMGEHLSTRGRKPDEEDFDGPSIVPPEFADELAGLLPPGEEAPEVETPVTLEKDFFEGIGFVAEIAAMRKAAKERRAAYFVAVTTRQKGPNIRARLADWMMVSEALRKIEKDLPGIRKANNQAVDRAEMEAAVGLTFQAFRKQAVLVFSQLVEKLGLGNDPDAQDAATVAVERLLRTLTELTQIAADEAQANQPPTDV